jgi:hypothetical protein
MSLFAVGCGAGGSSASDPGTILQHFQRDTASATKEYQGKTMRLSVDKVITANKTTVNAVEYVTVQGQVGTVVIDATIADPAEQPRALALKIGEPAIFEGEVVSAMGETAGYGALFMKATKVVPN